ncbi:conserved hypothetical protein [Cupriavidus taiwanensis]|nr:conserved hypothetical protein [Cupriavidus taiwanensis]
MTPQFRRALCGHAQARRQPRAIGRQGPELHAPVLLADRIGDARQAFGFEAGEEVGGQGGGILTLREGAGAGGPVRRRASHYTPRVAGRGRAEAASPDTTYHWQLCSPTGISAANRGWSPTSSARNTSGSASTTATSTPMTTAGPAAARSNT